MGSALGFMLGGALEGLGTGMAESARQRWEAMLREAAETRQDAREDKRATRDAIEHEKDRALRKEELLDAGVERVAAREERQADRKEAREDRRLEREQRTADRAADREQRSDYNKERLEIDRDRVEKSKTATQTSDDTIIDRIERSAERQAKNVMGEIDQEKYDKIVKEKARRYKDRPGVLEHFEVDAKEEPPPAEGGTPVTTSTAAPPDGVARPKTREEYDKLPPGTTYIDPQGNRRTKPRAQ